MKEANKQLCVGVTVSGTLSLSWYLDLGYHQHDNNWKASCATQDGITKQLSIQFEMKVLGTSKREKRKFIYNECHVNKSNKGIIKSASF